MKKCYYLCCQKKTRDGQKVFAKWINQCRGGNHMTLSSNLCSLWCQDRISFFFFFGTGFLSSGCPATGTVDQVGFKLRASSVSASQKAGIKGALI